MILHFYLGGRGAVVIHLREQNTVLRAARFRWCFLLDNLKKTYYLMRRRYEFIYNLNSYK